MRKFLLLLTIITCTTNCSISKKPEFKYIDNIMVKNISLRNITLKADAVFNNPNNLQGKLSIDSIQIFVDHINVGKVSAQEFDVPTKNEFTIPLEGTFSLSKIYKNSKKTILGNILNVIQADSLNIEYKGAIRYHLGHFSYSYPVNKEQKVRLK
ncbi:hypothetical protein [Aquimarina sp. I32.4]|uniref:hypothetical protein n=1 Tax=Aquimarina sp. I32.4 TaxID=2053903 RepID=UPI0011AF3A1C|nr:hypothetical protein [Aquimarina sp. I32.4]